MLEMEEAIEEEVEVNVNLTPCMPLAIVATERYDGWHACLAKSSEICGFGNNEQEAIGSLMMTLASLRPCMLSVSRYLRGTREPVRTYKRNNRTETYFVNTATSRMPAASGNLAA